MDYANKVVAITGGARGIGLAMAQAFREGKLGVFDYVNMRNIQADTEMRESISGSGPDIESTNPPPDQDDD